MFQARAQEITRKVEELKVRARELFGVDLSRVQVRFDLKGRAAGMAGVRGGAMYLRFNTQMMVNEAWNHIINDTVPHEVAHLVCFANPQLGRNHDTGWKRVCRMLGGNGERCHKEAVVYAKGNTYAYVSTAGKQINVSEKMHKNILRGATYTLRNGGGKISNQCQYSLAAVSGRPVAQPKPAAPAPTPAAPLVLGGKMVEIPIKKPAAAGASKAEMVRARIAQAKARREDGTVVVQWAIDVLGMSRSLANTYVKNNW